MTAPPEPLRPTAAVGVVCLRGSEVLLIRRGNAPLQGHWSLPGGRIEWGERAADAAMRELAEETHVEATLLGLVEVADGLFYGRDTAEVTRHYVLADYAARWVSGEPRAGDDAAAAAFHPLSALDALGLWDETLRVIDMAVHRYGDAAAAGALTGS